VAIAGASTVDIAMVTERMYVDGTGKGIIVYFHSEHRSVIPQVINGVEMLVSLPHVSVTPLADGQYDVTWLKLESGKLLPLIGIHLEILEAASRYVTWIARTRGEKRVIKRSSPVIPLPPRAVFRTLSLIAPQYRPLIINIFAALLTLEYSPRYYPWMDKVAKAGWKWNYLVAQQELIKHNWLTPVGQRLLGIADHLNQVPSSRPVTWRGHVYIREADPETVPDYMCALNGWRFDDCKPLLDPSSPVGYTVESVGAESAGGFASGNAQWWVTQPIDQKKCPTIKVQRTKSKPVDVPKPKSAFTIGELPDNFPAKSTSSSDSLSEEVWINVPKKKGKNRKKTVFDSIMLIN
jgi:hypothetical protein